MKNSKLKIDTRNMLGFRLINDKEIQGSKEANLIGSKVGTKPTIIGSKVGAKPVGIGLIGSKIGEKPA